MNKFLYMEKNSKIYIAGHTGLVGSAIVRELQKQDYLNLITRTHQELDLLDTQKATSFFKEEKPEYVILAAAKVGGIHANNAYSAEFIYENLQVQNNVIHNSYLNKVKKLLFLGSSCIYPMNCPQPIKEEYFLTGELEKTNEAYAIAKIAGIKMCQNYNKQYGTRYICVMPTNLYGTNDRFHPENSHVLPALIYKIHSAKIKNAPFVTIWGTGKPYREFLFIDDFAKAALLLLNNYNSSEIINVGSGKDLTTKELAEIICSIIEYKGEIRFDASKPDGTPRKLLDISKINKLGWAAETSLKTGIKKTYEWYLTTLNRAAVY